MFLNTNKKEYIKYFIKNNLLVNLNLNEYNILMEYLFYLIEFIVLNFNIDENNYNLFWANLCYNNNSNIISLLNLLLPYIDTKNNFELFKLIKNINDICTLKKNNKFVISNFYISLYTGKNTEDFSLEKIKSNLILLLNTIEQISNKLYINWTNIIPLTITNYKNSSLYKYSLKLYYANANEIKKEEKYLTKLFNTVYYVGDIKCTTTLCAKKYFYIYDYINNDPIYANDRYNEITNNLQFYETEGVNDIFINLKNLKNKSGINIGDIFNTLYYYLFLDIKNIKWLLYQNIFDNEFEEMYLKKFNDIIAIKELYTDTIWSELTDNNKELFITKLKTFFEKASINKKYLKMLIHIMLFFENKYEKYNLIKNTYNYISLFNNDIWINIDNFDELEEDLNLNNILFEDLIKEINKIPFEYLYDYFLDVIMHFKNTWYGKKIIKINKFEYEIENIPELTNLTDYIINELRINNFILKLPQFILPDVNEYGFLDKLKRDKYVLDFKIKLTYKFIYNYAKSFFIIYHEKEKIINIRNNWFNLNLKDKLFLLNVLNCNYIDILNYNIGKNDIDKINILSFTTYYSRIYDIIIPKKYNIIIGNFIINCIKEKLIDITFETHIYKGLYSTLNFDNNYFKKNLDDINSNGYYYLTNEPYCKLVPNYLKNILEKKSKWFQTYSFNWIFQINLFHKFINNRVIFVTGATGQGKSTQIPKLMLYGLKLIYGKDNGHIICSLPRIMPTIKNANFIANELGTPIGINKIFSHNPYIQYSTKGDKFNVIDNTKLSIKFVTDKKLLDNLLNNIFLKKIYLESNNEIINEDINTNNYSANNLFDVIMIDESHEHNVNMDLILTIARDTVKFNNSLKLIIISATMDYDELIYRKYYQEIDDNFMYPYNFENETIGLDRFYIDRRIHISPPAETTLFPIKEIYLDKNIDSYPTAELEAINILQKLIYNNKINYNLLFFTIGVAEIKKLVGLFNNFLNVNKKYKNYICLPYYGDIPSYWKKIFLSDNIEEEINNITVDRTDLVDVIFNNKTTFKTVPKSTYKYYIMFATNIAEASITLSDLEIIIDTGYNKKIIYDSNLNTYTEKVIEITEDNRIQRKGRVGRVGSGTIYYAYKYNSKLNNKKMYNICFENIFINLYNLLNESHLDDELFIDLDLHKLIGQNISLTDKDQNIFNCLIIPQYTYLNKYLYSVINLLSATNKKIKLDKLSRALDRSRTYRFNIDKTVNIIPKRLFRSKTGYFMLEHLFDINGIFYLIHPDEIILKRNLLTRRIEYVGETKLEYIVSTKIYDLFKMSLIYNILISNLFRYDSLFYNSDTTEYFLKIKLEYNKSIIYNILDKLERYVDFNIDKNINLEKAFVTTLMYSFIFNNTEIITIIILLMINLNYNISYLLKNNNYNDDLETLYYYAVKIYNELEIKKINFKYHYDKTLKIIKTNINNYINKNYAQIPLNYLNNIIKMRNNNKFEIDNNQFDYYNLYINNDFKLDINPLIDIFQKLKIDLDDFKIRKFYQTYLNILNIKNKLENIDYKNYKEWLLKNLPVMTRSNNNYENIKICFLYGFSKLNIVYLKDNKYYNLYFNNEYYINKFTRTPKSEFSLYINNINNILYIMINTNLIDIIKINLLFFTNLKKVHNQIIMDALNILKESKYIHFNFLLNYKVKNEYKKENILEYPNNILIYLKKYWIK